MAKNVSEIRPLSLSLIGGFLLMLLSITGCSDTPLGSMLTPGDLDKYTISNGGGLICIENGVDSACTQLVPQGSGGATINAPVIHIHPQRLIYVFYYEGRPILRAERAVDTTIIAQQLRDTGRVQPRSSGANTNNPPRGNTGGNTGSGNTAVVIRRW